MLANKDGEIRFANLIALDKLKNDKQSLTSISAFSSLLYIDLLSMKGWYDPREGNLIQ